MIWSVPKSWVGSTCIIIASGPSMKTVDLSVLKSVYPQPRVITINDSWRLYPTADAHYFCDAVWWDEQVKRNYTAVDGFTRFTDRIYAGFWVKGSPSSEKSFHEHREVHVLEFTGQLGLETDPHGLRHGSNSGYQAINLVYHFGASKIVLLGYDMKCSGNMTHWHGGRSEPSGYFAGVLKRTMLPLFEHLVKPLESAGIEVLNATPDSALKCWPLVTVETALRLDHFPLPCTGGGDRISGGVDA